MQTLGILGLGNYTTAYYTSQLNARYLQQHGGYSTCPFVLLNANFNAINPYLPNQFAKLKNAVLPYLKHLNKLGITHLLVPNITLHECLDMLMQENDFGFQFIHPLTLAVKKLSQHKVDKAIIIGSAFTMNHNYIANYFKQYQIEVVKPDHNTIELLDTYRLKTYNGEELDNDAFCRIVEDLSHTAMPIIACTELSILSQNCAFNKVDMADEQINEAINIVNLLHNR